MTRQEIEHMWKVASNDPNHDTNWNDAVVIAFAKLVAQHEREACAYRAGIALLGADRGLLNRVDQAIRARGQA
jgi:hypothetical protein